MEQRYDVRCCKIGVKFIMSSIIKLSDNAAKRIKEITKKIFNKQKQSYVLYGGSVDGKNIKKINNISSIDGFLIGGASKTSKKFIDIIKNYYR